MAVITVPVSTGNNNGYAVWSNRANGSGTVFNPGTLYPFIGPHYDNAVVFGAWFYFRLQNIPQGTVLNSAILNLRTNNAYGAGGGSNHIYIAVENNLTPTAVGSAVANGTLGTQPWQRLGRQTAATAIYSNRCGPTHAKAGQTLATYGAHVRDSSALIYKAYADNRGVAVGAWWPTDDFKPALQVLINDPGWNSIDQWVMIHAFSDAEPTQAATANVGHLGSFVWDNGVTGTTGYANGGGQLRFQSVSGSVPELIVDYVGGANNSAGFFYLMQ